MLFQLATQAMSRPDIKMQKKAVNSAIVSPPILRCARINSNTVISEGIFSYAHLERK